MRKAAFFSALALIGAVPSAARMSVFDNVLANPVLVIEGGRDSGNELALRRGGVVTSVRILPGHLTGLLDDVAIADQKTLLRKGTALSLYRTTRGDIFCAVQMAKPNGGKIPCLADSDNDGKFDHAMKILLVDEAGASRAGVIYRGEPIPIVSVGHTELNPADYPLQSPVEIILTGAGRDNASFAVVVYVAGKKVPIRGLYRGGKGSFPIYVDVFGARLEIMSFEDKVTHLRIVKAIPAQPFQLSDGII